MVQSSAMSATSETSVPARTREFTVATFVVHDRRVLLLWHRKLRRWLPPGGHIEAGELPDEAAVREVREETGIAAELVGERGLPVSTPRQLTRPAGIQLEEIQPGHQHVDLIYFARPVNPRATVAERNGESEAVRWFALNELAGYGVGEDVRLWSGRAVETVEPIN